MPEIEPPVNDCISDSYILISLGAAVLFLYFSSRNKKIHLHLWNRFNCRYLDDRKCSWWFPLMLTNTRGHCLFLYFVKEKALCPTMGFPLMEQCCLGCWVGTSSTLKLCFLSVDCMASQEIKKHQHSQPQKFKIRINSFETIWKKTRYRYGLEFYLSFCNK